MTELALFGKANGRKRSAKTSKQSQPSKTRLGCGRTYASVAIISACSQRARELVLPSQVIQVSANQILKSNIVYGRLSVAYVGGSPLMLNVNENADCRATMYALMIGASLA